MRFQLFGIDILSYNIFENTAVLVDTGYRGQEFVIVLASNHLLVLINLYLNTMFKQFYITQAPKWTRKKYFKNCRPPKFAAKLI